MQKWRFVLVPAFVCCAALGQQRAAASERTHRPPGPVSCSELATDPDNGLAGNPAVKSVNSQIVPASGANAGYCQVNILLGANPNQNINIRVGLPINAMDGGTGGVQGAWNGRTQ